jgi:DNA-directed RNA polymerase subunit M/transcription elongation factor TFIIS
MLNKIISPAGQEMLLAGFCPDCGAAMLLNGPRGGLARNVLCGACRTEFNVSPLQCERLAAPSDPARQKEVYGVDEQNFPVASFPLRSLLTRKELDAGLARGCGDPHCTHHHEPQTEIFLKSNCHPNAGLSACYYKDGTLILTCRLCHRLVVKILVAS